MNHHNQHNQYQQQQLVTGPLVEYERQSKGISSISSNDLCSLSNVYLFANDVIVVLLLPIYGI
jgi:predicted Zn-dependent peptidase